MNSLISRGNLFDEFFRDVAPGFYVKPLHGTPCRARLRSRWMSRRKRHRLHDRQGLTTAHASRRGFDKALPPFSLARAAICSWCSSR